MKDNIIKGQFLTASDIDTDKVLDAAKGQLYHVLIIGECHTGDGYFASSTGDKAELLLMVELFKQNLLSGHFD